jgi:hypothetical protein
LNYESVLDRADFLERNKAELNRQMRVSDIADPVGVVADLRDFHGRQFAMAVGMAPDVIDREVARYASELKIPTITSVISWQAADAMMPNTSPTANRNLDAARFVCKATGKKLVIAITAKGNRYDFVDV